MARQKTFDVVALHGSVPFTTTLAVAEGCKQAHRAVIRLVRKYQTDFEELGRVSFQSSLCGHQGGGSATEYVELSEPQAAYLITLFRNTPIVRAFKLRLVKAFDLARREILRLRSMRTDPDWKVQRTMAGRVLSVVVNRALIAHREALGKETTGVHFMTEAKLINGVTTGRFEGGQVDSLPDAYLGLFIDVGFAEAALLGQGVVYDERRRRLEERFTPRRLVIDRGFSLIGDSNG